MASKRTLAVNEALLAFWTANKLDELEVAGPYWEEVPVSIAGPTFSPYVVFDWIHQDIGVRSNFTNFYVGILQLKVYHRTSDQAGYALAAIIDALEPAKLKLEPSDTEGYVVSFLPGQERYRREDRMVFSAAVDFTVQRARPRLKG